MAAGNLSDVEDSIAEARAVAAGKRFVDIGIFDIDLGP